MDRLEKKEAAKLARILEHTSENPIVDPINGKAQIKARKKESNKVVASRLILLFYSSDANWQKWQFLN